MKNKLLITLIAAILFLMPGVTIGQTITLGTASKFVLFTTNGAMTCSGIKYLNHLTGNVGSNLAGSVTGFGNVDGVMHTADTATIPCTVDVINLYSQLDTVTPTGALPSPFGLGDTLVAGVYNSVGAATLTSSLVLNGQGNPNAVFIFQIGGLFSTDALSKVKLINGALACNVFWQINGAVNVGTGTTLRGTIVANGQIDMTSTLDTLEGRALALNAAVLVSQLVAYTPIGCGSPLLTGPIAPSITDSLATYGVFSSIGAVTATPITYVIGNVGGNSQAPTGFDPLNVTGTIHSMDPSTAAAAGELTLVYNYLVALPADINLLDPTNFGHDLVLTPHSYQITGITQLTGNIILNAEGDINAVFVIKINGSFTTGTLSRVILRNGAQAKNVYWKIDGAVDIFSNSLFNGTLVVAGAIALETGDTLNGRAFTINGAIAINGSYVNNNPPPCNASPITGTQQVCQGLTTVLADADTSGTWSSSNNIVAAIGSSSGVVSGLTPGIDTITYVSPLACVSTITVTVDPSPAAINGFNSVCVGATITLSDDSTGGTWSSSNALIGTVGTISGIVGGIAPGTDTITYKLLSTGCLATKTITVNALPNAGTITGILTVCPTSTTALSDLVVGGVWSSVTPATATIGTSGIVTGVALGTTTISYTVTNSCGTVAATKVVTVSATTDAGTITGILTVCPAGTTTLSDIAGGGVWSSVTPATATIGTSGIVTGVTPGTTTISYTVTNSCGTAAATAIVTVGVTPNAGTITGILTVCPAGTTTLSDIAGGGVWSSVTPATATIGTSGIVTGVTPGTTTISYTVTNSCGTAAATAIVTVNISPDAGIITGPSNVCSGSSITLTDTTGNGTWSASNGTATVVSGIVTGVSAGIDTVIYTITGGACGTAVSTKTITINPIPDPGTINGPSSVCVGASITLTDAVTGGAWTGSNATATVIGGTVIGINAGTDTIMYTVTDLGCSATATKIIAINPLANAGTITGSASVCIGSSIALTDLATGGVWSSSNVNATIAGGIVTGIIAGSDNISYTVTNICGPESATKIIIIDPLPSAPVISTQSPSSVCTGTMFQNFGAATLPPSGVDYSWSAANAMVSDTGSTSQYALINFKTPGTAVVTLSATINGTGCATNTAVSVNVGTTVADVPSEVIYFDKSFICLQNNETAYQWGYDDASTLAPTTITGEINQDYLISNPQTGTNNYWVKVSDNGCIQKTYYNKPSGAAMRVNATTVSVYPNPANGNINVTITTTDPGSMQVELSNMLGQKLYTAAVVNNTVQLNVSTYPSGLYLINCYRDGAKISSTTFFKN